MHIYSQDRKVIVDTRIGAIYTQGAVVSMQTTENTNVILGVYESVERSREVMRKIFRSLSQGFSTFEMPES